MMLTPWFPGAFLSATNKFKYLAHHESPIAQWLGRPTGIWKVMGSTPIGGSENSFFEYFNLRTLLHYLHFIQGTNPFISSILLLFSLSVKCPSPMRNRDFVTQRSWYWEDDNFIIFNHTVHHKVRRTNCGTG